VPKCSNSTPNSKLILSTLFWSSNYSIAAFGNFPSFKYRFTVFLFIDKRSAIYSMFFPLFSYIRYIAAILSQLDNYTLCKFSDRLISSNSPLVVFSGIMMHSNCCQPNFFAAKKRLYPAIISNFSPASFTISGYNCPCKLMSRASISRSFYKSTLRTLIFDTHKSPNFNILFSPLFFSIFRIYHTLPFI
jgi:hypothetical protein